MGGAVFCVVSQCHCRFVFPGPSIEQSGKMKLLKKVIEKDGSGYVTLIPEVRLPSFLRLMNIGIHSCTLFTAFNITSIIVLIDMICPNFTQKKKIIRVIISFQYVSAASPFSCIVALLLITVVGSRRHVAYI